MRVGSRFRGWSRNGTWERALAVLHAAVGQADGRAEETASMVVIDTHLARGSSNGGATFHDRGGPFGRTKGALRVVAVDITGLPVGALVMPASTHENTSTELMLEHLTEQVVADGWSWCWSTAGSPPRSRPGSAGTTARRYVGSGGTQPSARQVLRKHRLLRNRLAPSGLRGHGTTTPLASPGRATRCAGGVKDNDRTAAWSGARRRPPIPAKAPFVLLSQPEPTLSLDSSVVEPARSGG